MLKKGIEPGLLSVFRLFSALAAAYFAVMIGYVALKTHTLYSPAQIQQYLNLTINLLVLGYLYWHWLQRKLKYRYLPIALGTASLIPIISNALLLIGRHETDPYSMVVGSWSVFPMLFVPLLLTAWQYGLGMVILLVIVTAGIDLAIVSAAIGTVSLETLPILAAPIFRGAALGTAGHVVARLVNIQKAQRKELLLLNLKLSQHAATLEQLAISRERNRLARELHDTLAHTLSGLAVNLEAIKLLLAPNQPEVREMVERALSNTRSGLTETRRTLKDLRSKQLEELGVGMAIRSLAEDAALRANFVLSASPMPELDDLTPDMEQCLYRVAQESLENIVRHADAKRVSIDLDRNDASLKLTINDDGKGLELENVDFENKLGIKGMRERAAMVGGQLEVTGRPGKGTTVQLTMEIPYGSRAHL